MTDNEQLLRQGYDAWNRGDWQTMERFLAPEFEVDATDRVLNPDSYSGIDGFRRLAAEMAEVWDTWEIEPLEIDEGEEPTFVAHLVRARGKGSGVEVVQTYWSVWTLRDGRAAKLALYVDRGRARGGGTHGCRLTTSTPCRRAAAQCGRTVTFRRMRTNIRSTC